MIRLVPFLLCALLFVPACGDDDPAGPEESRFDVTFDALPALGHGRYYEAWVTVPGHHGARHDERLSLGKFVRNSDGTLAALGGGEAVFALAAPADLDAAVDVLVTVEADGASVPGPVLLAGTVTGDPQEGRATLTVAHPHAVGADLSAASGSFILATPTDGEGANEHSGIWFTGPSGAPSLELPALSPEWVYHAHVFHGGHSLSIGTFTVPDAADSDGGGPEAGVETSFAAPGSDFLASGHDFADGKSVAFVVIEPAVDHHEERAALRHDTSFPVRVLEAVIPPGAAARESIALGRPGEDLPSGEVVFTR